MTSTQTYKDTKLKCPRCSTEMMITRQIIGGTYSVVGNCDKCFVQIDLTQKKSNMKNIDKEQKVMRVRIPKLKDEFYFVGINDGETQSYNPITRTVRSEKIVDNDVEHSTLLADIMVQTISNNDTPQG